MRRIGTLLPSVLREIARNEETALVFIRELWPQMVGKDLADKAFPAALERRTLILEVSDGAWAAQMVHFHTLLKQSINSFWELELVEHIKFQTRPQS